MSIRYTKKHGNTQQNQRHMWIFQKSFLNTHHQSQTIVSTQVEQGLKNNDQAETSFMTVNQQHRQDSITSDSWTGSTKNENLLRNKTQRLQRTLADIKQKLVQLQQLRESQIMLQKPSKELAVVKMPVAPMGYMNNNFLLCGRDTLELLVLVMTDYREKQERTQFRDHWRQLREGYIRNTNLELKWRFLFVIGHDYENSARDVLFTNEAIFKRDLLRVHTPTTRTMATIFGALHWAHNGCSYRNILVIRPNMALNIPVLYKLLHKADRYREDFFMYHTLPPSSFQKSLLQKQQQKQHSIELDILFRNSAWMASRDALGKILPLMNMYSNSVTPIHYKIIWNYLAMLKVKRLQEDKLVSNLNCHYQPEYALNTVPAGMCLKIIGSQLNATLINKDIN